MNKSLWVAPFLALVGVAIAATSVQAFFHLWDFSEIFSSADGSVQFIEFHTTAPSEIFANGVQIRSTSNTYTFNGNLSGSTTNKNLLVATPGFESLPGGVVPDFPDFGLPANFFDPAGDTLRLCQSTCTGVSVFDSRTFVSVPTDDVMSLNFPSNTTAVNSPTNFAGASGSVNLSPTLTTGDYNDNGVVDAADYTVWRNQLGQAIAMPNETVTLGMVTQEDYAAWKANFGNAAGSGSFSNTKVPEPATLVLLTVGTLATCSRRRAAAP